MRRGKWAKVCVPGPRHGLRVRGGWSCFWQSLPWGGVCNKCWCDGDSATADEHRCKSCVPAGMCFAPREQGSAKVRPGREDVLSSYVVGYRSSGDGQWGPSFLCTTTSLASNRRPVGAGHGLFPCGSTLTGKHNATGGDYPYLGCGLQLLLLAKWVSSALLRQCAPRGGGLPPFSTTFRPPQTRRHNARGGRGMGQRLTSLATVQILCVLTSLMLTRR